LFLDPIVQMQIDSLSDCVSLSTVC
jgi:hypothetical protein